MNITLGLDTRYRLDTFNGSANPNLAGPEYVYLIPGQNLTRAITIETVPTSGVQPFE